MTGRYFEISGQHWPAPAAAEEVQQRLGGGLVHDMYDLDFACDVIEAYRRLVDYGGEACQWTSAIRRMSQKS